MKKAIKMVLIVSAIVFASNTQNYAQNPVNNPVVSFTPTKTVVCPGKTSSFTNNSYVVAPATSVKSFKWTFGPSCIPSEDTTNWNPQNIIFSGGGTVYVTLEVIDDLGQKSLKGVQIIVPYYNSSPQISPQNTKTMCIGDSVVLSVQAGFSGTYQWTLNNTNISGATDSAYVVKSDGYYGCNVSDANGCSWGTWRYVQYNQSMNPKVQIWNNKGGSSKTVKNGEIANLCMGDNLTANAQLSWGSQYVSVIWSNGNIGFNTVIDSIGTYSYTVSANGCTEQSDTFTVALLSLPIPLVVVPLKTIYCAGDTLPVIYVANNGYTNIAWGIGGQYYNWNISLVDSFIVASSGTYGVMVTDANGCSDTSGVFKVTFNPSPNQPTISPDQYQPGCHIWCDNFPGCGYQWLLNDAILVGENTQYMDVSKYGSGFYKVEVTNSSGCSSISDPNFANCTATGVLEFGEKVFKQTTLSQNPAHGSVEVFVPENSEIQIVSLMGQVLKSENVSSNFVFDLYDIPSGIYIVKTINKNGSGVQKLLIQ